MSFPMDPFTLKTPIRGLLRRELLIRLVKSRRITLSGGEIDKGNAREVRNWRISRETINMSFKLGFVSVDSIEVFCISMEDKEIIRYQRGGGYTTSHVV